MCNEFIVAKYFMQKEPLMTVKYFQKLTYYAYSWYIAKYNDSADNVSKLLFYDEKPRAWKHGPVFANLYYVMTNNPVHFEDIDISLLDNETKEFLDNILKIYGKYSGNNLELMTKAEEPWQKAFGIGENTKLSDIDIFVFYSGKVKQN